MTISTELGSPLPQDEHAVSVSLPTWKSIVGYEMGDAAITSKMQLGYPRFLFHPKVIQLFKKVPKADGFTDCLLFLNYQTALDCLHYIHHRSDVQVCLDAVNMNGFEFYAVFFNQDVKSIAKEFWQHTGMGISSRFADAILSEKNIMNLNESGSKAKLILKDRISSYVNSDHVYLFPSGMSAIYQALNLVWKLCPDLKTAQFGFPYVDSLKLQEKFGFGCEFFGKGDNYDLERLEKLLIQGDRISAVVCEFPSNPLLRSVDLEYLRELANQFNFIIIIDDTIGGFVNVDLLKYTDIIVSSLTKSFSGTGNLMAGSLILNQNSIYFEDLDNILTANYQDAFWCEDAVVLESNSRDYKQRVHYTNEATEYIVDYLVNHPKVKKLFYPKFDDRDVYAKFVRKNDSIGYGSLFSIIFFSESDAIAFYDRVVLLKGPSLGTNFTLICPYTLLAHFRELERVSEYGVDSNLIRFSVGMEDYRETARIIRNALDSL